MDAKEYTKIIRKKQEEMNRKILLAVKEFEKQTGLEVDDSLSMNKIKSSNGRPETISVETIIVI